MKRLVLISLLAVLLGLAFVSISTAQMPQPEVMKKQAMMHRKMHQGLNLTEEQQNKIAELRLQFQKTLLPLQTEMRGKMAELHLLQTEANPNLKKMDQLIDQIGKIRTKIQKEKIRHQVKVRKLLTPEQQVKWDSRMLQGPGPRMKGKMGRHRARF